MKSLLYLITVTKYFDQVSYPIVIFIASDDLVIILLQRE